MGHNLHFEDGQAAMFAVREIPWHGLGTILDHPATSAEAIKAAHLDWRVKKVPLWACEGPLVAQVPGKFAVVPENRWGNPDCPIYGVVKSTYTPLQNSAAFAFFDSIVGMDAAMYHTAGALDDGRRVWLLAKLPGHLSIVGDDISEKYLLLANGHDGDTAVQMKFTPVRVVCQNTLALALSCGQTIAVHHGASFWRRMNQAKEAMGIINGGFAQIETKFRTMASISLTKKQLDAYLAAIFPLPNTEYEAPKRHVRLVRQLCARLFEAGRGNDQPRVRGTLWAAFNGITEYVDHCRGFEAQRRLSSIWFGQGYQIKARAYRIAEQYPACLPAELN